MSLAFDIRGIPPEMRLDAWRHAACRLIHPMVVNADTAPTRGLVVKRDGAGIHTIRVSGVRSTVERPATLIRADDPTVLQLTMVLRGRLVVEQDDAGGEVGDGGLVWYSSSHAYRLSAPADFDLIHVLVPGTCARLLRESLAERAVPVAVESASSQLLPPFLRAVVDWQSRPAAHHVGGALESALLHMIGSLPGGLPGPRSRGHPDTFARATEHVTLHLHEPDLGPARIAAALNVSLRHLHASFSRRGLSVGAYVRNERLDGAARDLVDPAHATEEVGEIARRWGFSSAAHFSRVFVDRFGQAPSRLRRTAAGRSTPGRARPRGGA